MSWALAILSNRLCFKPCLSCSAHLDQVSTKLCPLCISWNPTWACWAMRGAAIWSTLRQILLPPGTWTRACVSVLNCSSHSAVDVCVCSLPRGMWRFYSCLSPMVIMVSPGGRMARGPLGVAISTSMISSWFPRTLIHWWCRGSTVLHPSPVLDNCTLYKRGNLPLPTTEGSTTSEYTIAIRCLTPTILLKEALRLLKCHSTKSDSCNWFFSILNNFFITLVVRSIGWNPT